MRIKLSLLLSFLIFCSQSGWACRNTVHLNKYATPGNDVTQVLQHLVDKYNTIVVDEGEWLISGEIRLRSNVTIKGVGANKSIIKRNGSSPLRGGKLFYTEKVNTDIYTKHDPNDDFKPERVKYDNIHFKDLTIDFNRSPKEYTHDQLTKRNLYGIALIWTSRSSVKRCRFMDMMTANCNNGYPAIVIFQSENIKIQGNVSEGVTFVKTIFSKNVTVANNHCISSVGTPLSFISGTGHRCLRNRVENVFWEVSCIGMNSTNSIVRGNIVTASEGNISCLTLGHEPVVFRADNTIAEQNVLHSMGCRSLIIQNGCGVVIKNNVCTCVIGKDAPELTSGAIVASGRTEGIYDIKIIDNTLTATGCGNRGCVTYRGTGHLIISGNIITANRGVSVLSAEKCEVEIIGNTINSTDYSVTSNSAKIKVQKNTMSDGLMTNSADVVISDNKIGYTSHCTYLGTKWENVVIEHNRIVNASGREQLYAFLLNGANKDESYDEGRIIIRNNKVVEGAVKKVISVSSNKAAPQLERVRNIR